LKLLFDLSRPRPSRPCPAGYTYMMLDTGCPFPPKPSNTTPLWY